MIALLVGVFNSDIVKGSEMLYDEEAEKWAWDALPLEDRPWQDDCCDVFGSPFALSYATGLRLPKHLVYMHDALGAEDVASSYPEQRGLAAHGFAKLEMWLDKRGIICPPPRVLIAPMTYTLVRERLQGCAAPAAPGRIG